MVLSIWLLPAFSVIISGIFGRYLGANIVGILSSALSIVAAIVTSVLFVEIVLNHSVLIYKMFPWLTIESMDTDMAIILDAISISMLIPVTYISAAVLTYTIYYMHEDPCSIRFTCYISLFTFFMIVLVTGNNFLVMFVGWEGIGVSSYLLINFWFTSNEANQSSISALLVNRVGDVFLTVFMSLMYYIYGGLSYSQLFTLSIYKEEKYVYLLCVMLIVGSLSKSAQMPFTKWLPESMVAPTPTSSLLHAATLVTAGVYVLLRSAPMIDLQVGVQITVLLIGSVTSLLAGLTGMFQNDIKRIIAYSTVAQIGMCFMSVGLGEYNLSLYHLVNHSMYKALLFLCSGVIIHSISDLQDIRKMGGLKEQLTLAYSCLLIASLSLSAIPGLSGYYSKDLIIETSWGIFSIPYYISYWLSLLSAVCTSIYSFNIIYKVFLQEPQNEINFYKQSVSHGLNYGWREYCMIFSLVTLTVLSIFIGYFLYEPFVGYGVNTFSNSLSSYSSKSLDLEFKLTTTIKVLPLTLSMLAIFVTLYVYEYSNLSWANNLKMYTFFNQRLFHNILYNVITAYVCHIGYKIMSILDLGFIRIAFPLNIWNTVIYSKARSSIVNDLPVTSFPLLVLVLLISLACINISNVALIVISGILYTYIQSFRCAS